ncbi:MAG: thymidine phosphorylase [Chloroherpetonaceae bacterium]|nr:thymidine phosphorylase [Chloroherpetonaceae bacterium]
MNPVELIRKKRDGGKLTAEEISFFFTECQKKNIAEYQASAMLMAIFFNGLNELEMTALCRTMVHSGKVVDLSFLKIPKVDKHSTGGVGDKTSLILAPIVSSLGVAVPMISGRGLGHTGGTLDKLESIPGFRINLSEKEYKAQLKKLSCSLIGQTESIAPLDKLLYSLRDVTATVESIPLIASSIMSKKIASGLDSLVLDVKTGRGAFMQEYAKSKELAETLIKIGKSYGKKVSAFITDMNEPLGFAVGNWLEVRECVRALQGEDIADLMEVTYALSGEMLRLAGKCKTLEKGIELSKDAIQSGKAFDQFLKIAKAQGGDISPLIDEKTYPKSKYTSTIYASKTGFIASMDSLEIGLAAIELGAGRIKKEDAIEPKAGIMFLKKCGDKVQVNSPIAEIYSDKKSSLESVSKRVQTAIAYSNKMVAPKSKILEYLK